MTPIEIRHPMGLHYKECEFLKFRALCKINLQNNMHMYYICQKKCEIFAGKYVIYLRENM